jgi:hypothetical protein
MDKLTWRSTLIALLIGLACAFTIWILQPYNDHLLMNSRITTHYLPAMGIGMLLILTLGVNPLLRWKLPQFALSTKQLALILGIILVACTSTAVVQMWPHGLAAANVAVNKDKALNDAHKEMGLPGSLYLDPVEYRSKSPVSLQMARKLDRDNEIPWSAWTGPAFAWGSMIVFVLLLMAGMALIVYPQWRNNERLPFPLLTVQRTLIEAPEGTSRFAPIFRSGLFWAGVIGVTVVYGFAGLKNHTGNAFPAFKLEWGLWEDVWGTSIFRHMHWWVKWNKIVFLIVGITYFVPNRVAFSIWATVALYQVYICIGAEYFAPFHGNAAIEDHRNGAILGVSIIILWLGRKQWKAVMKSMFRPAENDVDRRNRVAGLMFCIGCLGLLVWQMWAGNAFIYAVFAVIMVVLTTLVLARIVAETGIPLTGNSLLAGSMLSLLPISWLSGKAIYLTNSVDLIIGNNASLVSGSVTTMHGLGLDEDEKPRRQAKLAMSLLGVTVLGLVVAGAVHLSMGYTHDKNLKGREVGRNIGALSTVTNGMDTPLKNYARKSWGKSAHNRIAHTIFGLILGVALQIGCLLSPLWPLHPVGLLMMATRGAFIKAIWPSILLGWALKRGIVIYGGAKTYRKAKPLFLGLIVGGVFSELLWAIVPAVLVWLGGDASEINAIRIYPHWG